MRAKYHSARKAEPAEGDKQPVDWWLWMLAAATVVCLIVTDRMG